MNNEFDSDKMRKQIEEIVEELVEGVVENQTLNYVEDAVEDILPERIHDILNESLANCELVTKDGSILRHAPMMILMNPDQTMTVRCFGGLRVKKSASFDLDVVPAVLKQSIFEAPSMDRESLHVREAWQLEVQTWVSCWEPVAEFITKAEAIEALKKVNQAILSGQCFYQM